MRALKGWTIARVRGVPLRLHISLLLLLIYIVAVGAIQLPLVAESAGVAPDKLRGNPILWGLVFGVSLFASVAVHEFGHAFVALAMGVRVRGITLMMLGGYSDMERIPDRPYAEFKLAVIGPIVSLVIGGALLFLRTKVGAPELQLFCYWVGSANIVVAVFNLLPAFPLDGGRALRSLIAARKGQIRATAIAVKVSRVLAWALGIFGFFQFNLLMVAIAFFIYAAADSELMVLMSKEILQGMTVGEVARHAEPVREADTVEDAAARMIRSTSPVLPVLTESGVPAIIDLQSVSRLQPDARSKMQVRDAMTVSSRSLDSSESLGPVFQELAAQPGGALPVTEDRRITGVVRIADIKEAIQLHSIETRRKAG